MSTIVENLKSFFMSEKKEKKRLREEIKERFYVNVSEDYSKDKLEETLRILEDEKVFLEKHKDTKFTFLGYIMDEESELPKFFYDVFDTDKMSFTSAVTPFTPKTFIHCMKNLEDAEKLRIFDSYDSFKKMFFKIADSAKYQEVDWALVLPAIRNNLRTDVAYITRKLSDSITAKDLSKVDWEQFGAEIKPYLAPSYKKKPESVDIKMMPNSRPVVYLKMQSKTTPSYRMVRVDGNDVYQAKNNDKDYEYSKEMSSVWREHRREILINYASETKRKQNSASTM